MKLALHPEALQEYEEAASDYEARQEGLGDRFILSIEAAFSSIKEAPDRWPILEADVRRRLTKVFPYAVLYTIEVDHVLVVAVMHCRQQPGYWRRRTTEK